jgi:hypothetical protein
MGGTGKGPPDTPAQLRHRSVHHDQIELSPGESSSRRATDQEMLMAGVH